MILTKRLRVQGFIVYGFAEQMRDFKVRLARGSAKVRSNLKKKTSSRALRTRRKPLLGF